MRTAFALLLGAAAIGRIASAQARVQSPATPRIYLAPDITLPSKSYVPLGGRASLAIGPGNRIVLIPRYGQGNISALDSAGASLGWKVPVGGRSDSSEIGWIDRVGWAGRTMWVSDPRYAQIVLLDDHGAVTKSVRYPSWVRPTWAERRKYPVYANMQPLAYYADGGMLVIPDRPRALLETPGFDRTVDHVMRIDQDGVILRDIAQMSGSQGRLELRGQGNNMREIPIPFYGRTMLKVSPDGDRIVTVRPALTAAEHGYYVVTALSGRGDTVFSRRVPMVAMPVSQSAIDSATRNPGAFGKYSVEQVRAMLRKEIPAYRSLVIDAYVGFDHSIWIVTRSPIDSIKSRDALVLSPAGAITGTVTMPDDVKDIAIGEKSLWGIQKGTNALVRRRLQSAPAAPAPAVTPARPARTGKAGGA